MCRRSKIWKSPHLCKRFPRDCTSNGKKWILLVRRQVVLAKERPSLPIPWSNSTVVLSKDLLVQYYFCRKKRNLDRLDSKHQSGHGFRQFHLNRPQWNHACQAVQGQAISLSDFMSRLNQARRSQSTFILAQLKHFSTAPFPSLFSILQKCLPTTPVFPSFLSSLLIPNVPEPFRFSKFLPLSPAFQPATGRP